MSSRYVSENSTDDITTDAFPSSPREDVKDFQRNVNEDQNKNDDFEETNTNSNHTHAKKKKTRGFSRVKRVSPPTAYASVININNSEYVHVGANVTYNFSNGCHKNEETTDVVETGAIKALFNNSNPVTREDLLFVSTHLNERWQDVGRALNFSDGQIKQFILDHKHYGIKEAIYQLLLDWSRNESNATVGKLSSILWAWNQKDVVKMWSEKQ